MYSKEDKKRINKIFSELQDKGALKLDYYLLTEEEKRWKVFIKNLDKTKNFSSLSLQGNGLSRLKSDQWTTFWEILNSKEKLDSLDLSDNPFYNPLYQRVDDTFLEGLAKNETLTSISIAGTGLYKFSEEQWGHFFETIAKTKKLTSINFSKNSFGQVSQSGWASFCKGLANNKTLTSINLSNNGLGKTSSSEYWQIFFEALANNKTLTSINLSNNELGKMSLKSLQIFSDKLANNKSLTSIDLSNNKLDEMNKEELKILSEGLASNKTLTSINLRGNFIDKMSREKFELFFGALAKNETITSIDLGDISSSTGKLLFDMLQKNKNTVLSTVKTDNELMNNKFSKRIAVNLLPIVFSLENKQHTNRDTTRKILEFTTDQKTLDMLDRSIKNENTSFIRSYLHARIVDGKPSIIVELLSQQNDLLSIIQDQKLPLTSEPCVDFLKFVLNEGKWSNKGYTLFGSTKPARIVEMQKLLNSTSLSAPEKLEEVKQVLEKPDTEIKKWFQETFKLKDPEVKTLYKFIIKLIEDVQKYGGQYENKQEVKNQPK